MPGARLAEDGHVVGGGSNRQRLSALSSRSVHQPGRFGGRSSVVDDPARRGPVDLPTRSHPAQIRSAGRSRLAACHRPPVQATVLGALSRCHPASTPRAGPVAAYRSRPPWEADQPVRPWPPPFGRTSFGTQGSAVPPRRRTGPDAGQISRDIERSPAHWPAVSRASTTMSVLVRLANDTSVADQDRALKVAA